MAIFGTKKSEKKVSARVRSAKSVKLPTGKSATLILHPWFSEKAIIATERGVYTFAVTKSATKPQIAAAIKELYKVSPRKIRIVNLPAARVSTRTGRGKALRGRDAKAYVYLKQGETIQFA